MIELIVRVEAAQTAIDKHLNQALDWRQHDCAQLVTTALKALGHLSPLRRIRKYSSEKTALLAMRAARYQSMADAIDALGFDRIGPTSALAGDVVAFPADEQWGGYALGIALGDGRLIGFANGVCDVAPVSIATLAWRVTVKV